MNNHLKPLKNKKKTYKRKKFSQRNSYLVDRLIKISRISKVTKGGKKLSFRTVIVVGNENGKVGIGVGKANDVVNAFKKAKADGRKNLITLPITKSLSIPHYVVGNFSACKIIIRPSNEGSGVIAGGAVRRVFEVAGIRNVIAKQLGSNNLLNNARASIHALKNLTTKSEIDKKRNFNRK